MNGLTIRSSEKSKSFWKQMKMNTQQTKSMGHSKVIQAYLKKIEMSQTTEFYIYKNRRTNNK